MKFNVLLLVCALAVVSCKDDTKKAENADSGIEETIKETDKTDMSKDLLGTWERVDYPFSKIVVEGARIKFVAGEGNVEPAKFETYTISEGCPNLSDEEKLNVEKSKLKFIVTTDNTRCESFKIEGDSLTISGSTGNYEIVYKRK